MENIGERIRHIRESLGNNGKKMSQAEFAKKIGIGATAIGNLEAGIRNPSDRTILDICREYNVNETWLRTGEGEMFVPMSRTDEIAAFIGKTLSGGDNIKQRLIWALSQLDEEDWKVLEKLARDMAPKEKEKPGPE